MSDAAPDLYADSVQIFMGPFGLVLEFGVQNPRNTGQTPPKPLATVRMSPEHAKIMTILLKRNLRQFEQQVGSDIPLHPAVATQLGISKKEDW